MKAARFKAEQPGWKRAFTLPELLVVLAALLVLAAIILPLLARSSAKSSRIGCVNNLKQVGLAFRIFSGDNNDKYPMQVPMADGGVMGLLPQVSPAAIFLTMTNELGASKIVNCPNDVERQPAQDFGPGFTDRNVSFFVGLDASEALPQGILSGDRNLATNGVALKTGFVSLATNQAVSWTTAIHPNAGNILLSDGSVQQTASQKLRELVRYSGATNGVLRLAIP